MEEERPAPPPRAGPQRLRSPGFGVVGVLGTGFAVFAKGLLPLLLLTVLVYSPLLVYKAVELYGERPFLDRTTIWAEVIGRLLLGFMATAAVIYAVFERLRGERPKLRDSLRVALVRILPVAGAAILQVLPVAVTAGAAMYLFAIHFVAGLLALFFVAYVYCMLWMMIPVVVVERAGPFRAFRRSVVLTDGYKLRIFVILLVVWVLRIGAAYVIAKLSHGDAAIILWLVATLVVGALEATVNAVAYHDLRRAREGVGVEELLRVFA